MELAPIVLFAYNRPNHLARTIESLKKNNLAQESLLYVYCDGPKEGQNTDKIEEVREYVRTITGFKEIIQINALKNKGLANSVIDGVTEVVNKHGKVIVLEDDLEFSKYFLNFMNEGLKRYKNENKVMQITGHMLNANLHDSIPESFFLPITSCLGWGTWENAWRKLDKKLQNLKKLEANKSLQRKFNLNNSYPYYETIQNHLIGKVNSWCIIWYLSVFMESGLVLHPKESLVKHFGFDEFATHANKAIDIYASKLSSKQFLLFPTKLEVNKEAFGLCIKMFKKKYKKKTNKNYFKFLQVKKIVYSVNKRLKNILLKYLIDDNFINHLEKHKIQMKNKIISKKCISANSAVIYYDATIINETKERDKINIGQNTHIRGTLLVFNYGGKITIGDSCYVGDQTRIWSGENIIIGNNVLIAHNVFIVDTSSHEIEYKIRAERYKELINNGFPLSKSTIKTNPIIIEDYAWINPNSIILPGVKIKKGAIIAAGSVVTKDVEPFTLVAGNPAKFVKELPR